MSHPQGWDIADAVADGIDLAAFIRDCPTREFAADPGSRPPFAFLGFDGARYHFLPYLTRMPYAIERGRFGPSALLEIAPLSWWGDMSLIRDNGAIKTDAAQDWIVDEKVQGRHRRPPPSPGRGGLARWRRDRGERWRENR